MGSLLPAHGSYLVRIRVEHVALLMTPGHIRLGKPEHFSCRNDRAEIQEVAQPALHETYPLDLVKRDYIFDLVPDTSRDDYHVPCQGVAQGSAECFSPCDNNTGSDNTERLDQVRHPLEEYKQVIGGKYLKIQALCHEQRTCSAQEQCQA